jgi:hypothetical protein
MPAARTGRKPTLAGAMIGVAIAACYCAPGIQTILFLCAYVVFPISYVLLALASYWWPRFRAEVKRPLVVAIMVLVVINHPLLGNLVFSIMHVSPEERTPWSLFVLWATLAWVALPVILLGFLIHSSIVRTLIPRGVS